MPMPSVKKLYLASTMEELQEKASLDTKSIKSTPTERLCRSAERILEEANRMMKERDDERAFVLYFKFVDLVVHLKTLRSDFASCKNSAVIAASAESALEKAKVLKNSLSKRYSALKEANKVKEDEENALAASQKKQEEEKEEKEKAAAEYETTKAKTIIIDANLGRSLSCHELHVILEDPSKKCLIIDVRPEREFEESHIPHSNCINIPEEYLKPGMHLTHLESLLPSHVLSKWKERSEADYVIMIDYGTEGPPVPVGHPLRTVEDFMCKKSPENPLKRSPLILRGGYTEWLLCYPSYSLITRHASEPVQQPERALESFDKPSAYPDLDKVFNEFSRPPTEDSNRSQVPSEGPVMKSILVNGWVDDSSMAAKAEFPSVNRQTKPKLLPPVSPARLSDTVPVDENAHFTSRQDSTDSTDSGSSRQPPEVNRSLKPAWVPKPVVTNNRDSDVMSALNREEVALKENVSVMQEQLEKENEYSQLRVRKELEAEESKRIELQKQEEILLENLRMLEAKSRRHEANYLAMKEENLQIKKLLEEKNSEIQSQKMKEIEAIESRNAYMRQHVESLRQQRKKKEQEHRERSKSAIVDREKENKENISPKHHGSEQARYPSEKEYTVPLKELETGSSGRGLTRSFSSPNIAQMVAAETADVKRKYPTVDRSSKPKMDFRTVGEISALRMRNLNPTYGNVPARPVTGLRNLGNTCYMNSTIQCLSNTWQIANYFNMDQYRNHIRRNTKHGTNGEVAEEFAVIIKALWAGQYKSIYPKDFKNTASKHIPMCVGSEQQDSHEFLVVLMDKLHGDLNQGYDSGPPPNLDSLPESEASEKFWNHHTSKNQSKISETFEGLLKSTLSCCSCKRTSNSFEVFSCVSLPIPSSRCSLLDCLSAFLKPERMSGEAAWDCPSCKQKREAEKRLSFCRLPSVIIIQLKRFSYEGLWRRKIQAFVDFPLQLEMPYTTYGQGRYYTLYGIVNHFGYLEGGHYTAYCKNPSSGRWYKYDDQEVSEISESDIRTSAAYLLFYAAA